MGFISKLLGGNGDESIDQMRARKERARERGKRERRKEFREMQLEKEKKKGRRKALSLGERVQDVATKAGKKVAEEAKNFEAPDPDDFDDGGGRGEAFLDDSGGGGEAFLDDSNVSGEAFLDDFSGDKDKDDDILDF